MKLLNYIYTLLIAVLLGFFSFACSDDDVEQTEGEESADVYGGEPITTTVKVCVSAPDVSVDIESATRSSDNANIEYAQPENGGRFQNIVVVVTDNSDKVYAIHCNKWYDGAPTSTGVKQYEVIFPDLKINTTEGRVYALGNVSTDVYNTISGYTVSGTTAMSNYTEINNLIKTSNISVTTANLYKLSFKPQAGNFKVGSTDVTTACSGMPVNAVAKATIQKGATVFNVKMRRVCARLQVTFRNFTGQYIDYNDNTPKDNNVYVDQFTINRVLTTSSKYFYNGSAPSNTGTVAFDILKALGGTNGTNDHEINKIENGKDITISMYVFENTGTYKYNLKVDRGKSLGNRVESLEDGNVYVMWSDNLDPGDYENSENRCLGADDNNIKLMSMNDPNIIPFGSSGYGNRVFWYYTGGKFESCKVSIDNDVCTRTGKYIPESGYPKLSTSGKSFSINTVKFEGFSRSYLRIRGISVFGIGYTETLMISNNELKVRRFGIFRNEKPYYPWVFFAKYIIKEQTLGNITQIERNHSYELEFKVMPNYDTKQELLVNCVRRQNDIDWSETQK
jgi:hypothetical protein